MQEDYLEEFIEAVRTDPLLQKKVKSAANPQEVIMIAQQSGFKVSLSDFIDQRKGILELTDQELKSVSGGNSAYCQKATSGVLYCDNTKFMTIF